MSNIRLGNGPVLNTYLSGRNAVPECNCGGAEVGLILTSMGMTGSNLYNVYSGARCEHNTPTKAGAVAYIVENYKEESLKFKGTAAIKGMLEHVMKGSICLVFFKSSGGRFHSAALDLYLTDKLWVNSGVADVADEMWVWILGGRLPKTTKAHHSKSHHKTIAIF